MKQEAMQKHPEEWFFLHNFDVDRVFSTIRRTDYLVLFYIKMRQESHPDEKLYLADLAAEMGVKKGRKYLDRMVVELKRIALEKDAINAPCQNFPYITSLLL